MIIFLSLVFFLSGAAALIFEFLWFRLSGLVFGNSVWAASIVLSSFMGGLALGNGLMASRGDRIRFPIRLYAILELTIALSGIFLVFFFPHLTTILSPLFRPFLDEPAVLNAIRTFFAAVLMLIPTTAMGATLPLLVKAVNKRINNFGNVLGFLYGSNTLGAVFGVLLAEVFLIRYVGLMGTGLTAMGVNIFAAVLALVISSKLGEAQETIAAPAGSAVSLSERSKHLLAVGFFTGFIFLALEVIWFRFMLLFFNAFSLNFAVMLAVILLAIALGGLAASWWFKKRASAQTPLIGLLFFNALLLVLTYAKFYDLLQLFYFDKHTPEILKITLCSLFLIFPLSLNSGMIFTFLGKLLHQEINVDTRTTGLLTLANTLGSALGSFVAGFVLIPHAGVEISFLLLAFVYGGLILLVIDLPQVFRDRRTKARFVVLAALFMLIMASFPFGVMRKYLDIPMSKFFNDDGEIRVAFREGMSETVQYLQKNLLELPHYHRLMTNGHAMSNTTIAGKRYMKMFVYLPVALHPNPKRAALICFGCGMTAKALTDTKGLEHIEMVDISKDIIDLSNVIFPNPQENPINDPRVNLRIEDGRFFLLTTDQRFDLITGEPPPPKYRGIVNLYSQEHFQLIHDRLTDGGMVTYWLPVYMLTAENAKSILKAFCNVFPGCTLWGASGYNWMMVGVRNTGSPVSAEQVAAQWKDPPVAEELLALGFVNASQLGSFFVADAKRIGEWTRGSLPLTDNFPGRLDDGLEESVIVADVPQYNEFLNPQSIEANFATSPEIARLWPAGLRDAAMPYFPSAQAMVFDTPQSSLEFIQLLQKYLTSPLATDFDIYWQLDSDEYAQRIITQMLTALGQNAQTMLPVLQGLLIQTIDQKQHMAVRDWLEVSRHLAVRALIARDFLLAEKYYGLLGELSDMANSREFQFLRLYLLVKAGERQRAETLLQILRERDPAAKDRLEAYWQWLQTSALSP